MSRPAHLSSSDKVNIKKEPKREKGLRDGHGDGSSNEPHLEFPNKEPVEKCIQWSNKAQNVEIGSEETLCLDESLTALKSSVARSPREDNFEV